MNAIGMTLLHSLWEGAVVALALAVALCFLKSPVARYVAACLAMVVMVVGPVATFERLAPQHSLSPLPGGHGPVGLGRINGEGSITGAIRMARGADDLAWVAPFWMAGVFLFYLRGAMSWMAMWRLRRTGVCGAAESWQRRLDGLGTRMRVTRPVALLESCLAEVPVVIGYLRPVILMPVGLMTGLSAGQVESILLHELAHIRRYDYVVNLMQVFVEGLLFYHPAVWWISGVMRGEREYCCDELVVQVTGGAHEYATALAALEENRGTREALAATGGSLMKRIQRLLGKKEPRRVALMPVFGAAVLTVTAVMAMAAWQSGAGARMVVVPPVTIADKPVLLAQATPAPEILMPFDQQKTAAPSSQQKNQTLRPDKVLYESAVQNIARGNYVAAGITLHTLINTYAASEYLARAKATLESMTPFKQWLNQDVVYIISDEEKKAFLRVQTDEERTKFVEQFWLRRNPTPGTPDNPLESEHYRRIVYANEHFGTANIAGWRTDRGRIYIQYGPPDELEAHPAGGTYQRPAEQGGGATQTSPFEQWRYRFIEGIGENVIIEFVDTGMTGEYRMTMDPSAKDSLLKAQPSR